MSQPVIEPAHAAGAVESVPHALLISHKLPWPADDGKKAVLAGFLAYLIKRFGSANVTYVVVGHAPAERPNLPCTTIWVPPPSRLDQVSNALRCVLGLSQGSLQEAVTYSPSLARSLRALCDERAPCLVLMDTIRIGQCLTGTASDQHRVLYMDDLFHLRFERMLAMAADGQRTFAAAGTFGRLLPGPALALLEWPALRNALYRFEVKRVRQRELDAPLHFDTCLLINPHEAELLRQNGRQGRVAAVRPLLFPSASPLPRHYDGNAEYVLFGSLRHPLHRASVLCFLDQVVPGLVAVMPDLRLRIVGEGADDAVRAACARLGEAVELTGFVDDIAPLFARACALLVPSLAGGGLRLKAVTAMHHGLPIITTGEGVHGIPLVDGQSMLLENRIDLFAEPMRRLRDPALNQAVSLAALAVFEAEYGCEAVFIEYDQVFHPDVRFARVPAPAP